MGCALRPTRNTDLVKAMECATISTVLSRRRLRSAVKMGVVKDEEEIILKCLFPGTLSFGRG